MSELSGKALGIEVAEKGMGWACPSWSQFEYIGRTLWSGGYPVAVVGDADSLYLIETRYDRGRRWAPWRDLNDAWEVVEKLTSEGWRFEGMADHSNMYGDAWDVSLRIFGERGWRSVSGSASTPCEAILRAALAAKEASDETERDRSHIAG